MSGLVPVSVRFSAAERDLLKTAAIRARTTLSDFIRRKAVAAAEMEIVNNGAVTIPAADWEKFESWVKSPPKDLPRLRSQIAFRPKSKD